MDEQIVESGGETFTYQYQQLLVADALLALHVLFIAFVVFGLLMVFAGKFAGWRWVTNPYYRYIHLGAIVFVVLQSWLALPCPLTVWENAYRLEAGGIQYEVSFIAHWLSRLIYYEAPDWIFTLVYSLFGLLSVLSLVWIKPRRIGLETK
jgi:hypothetical protein